MNKKTKRIALFAQQAEEKRQQGMCADEAIWWFVEQLKYNQISAKGWFAMDDEMRRTSWMQESFWVIRTVRNNLARYAPRGGRFSDRELD